MEEILNAFTRLCTSGWLSSDSFFSSQNILHGNLFVILVFVFLNLRMILVTWE